MLINAAGRCGWIYVESQQVPRLPDEVLVTEWLVTALMKLNDITEDQAAQVVVYNRDCCVKYKKALDALLGTDDQTTIVMHTAGDKADEYKAYKRSRDEEKKLLLLIN